MANELEEITIDTLKMLSPHERHNAIVRRQEWLKKVRKEELDATKSDERKVEYFLKKAHNVLLRPELTRRQCCIVDGEVIMLCILFSFRTGKLSESFQLQMESKNWRARKNEMS